MPLVINGRFLTRPVTGVERYGRLLLRIIAREWPGTRVVVPGEATDRIDACGLEIVPLGGRGGHAWEQIQLPRAVGRRDVLLSPANTGPLRVRNQVVAIHDLAVIHHPEWFDRRFAAWYGFLLPRLARRAARVITVSSYSAADLIQTFTLHSDRVMLVQPFTDIASTVGSDADIGMPSAFRPQTELPIAPPNTESPVKLDDVGFSMEQIPPGGTVKPNGKDEAA